MAKTRLNLTEDQKKIVENYLLRLCDRDTVKYIGTDLTNINGHFIGIMTNSILSVIQWDILVKMQVDAAVTFWVVASKRKDPHIGIIMPVLQIEVFPKKQK